MEKLRKYFHNIIVFGVFASCASADPFEGKSLEERRKISIELLEKAETQHFQGTPVNMEGIEMALQADPQNAAAWRELSVPYLKRGLAHEWKPLFDKAVECDPVSWQGWRGYLLLFFYRDYEKAIRDFNATDTLTPNLTDYPQSLSVDYLRGLAYLGLKDYPTSESYFSKYIDEVTNNLGEDWVEVTAFTYRGRVRELQSNIAGAVDDYNTHLKYQPNSADGCYHLARIHKRQQQWLLADDFAAKAKEFYERGYYMHRDYVETFEEIYLEDITSLQEEIRAALATSR